MPLLPDSHILKFVDPAQWDFFEVPGKKLLSSFLQTTVQECAFVEELGASPAVLELRKPDWRSCGLVRLTVSELDALGLQFALNPEGCDWKDLAPAHGEITGHTRMNRPEILRRLQLEYLSRPPDSIQTDSVSCESCGTAFDVTVEMGIPDFRHDKFECECERTISVEGRVLDVS